MIPSVKIFSLWIALACTLPTPSCGQAGLPATDPETEKPLHLLIYSGTAGYRHESLSSGIKMIYDQAQQQNWVVTATTDGALFDEHLLPRFDVVIFLNPSGDALTDEEQIAFEHFMDSGKGVVGIHSAADFEYEWPFYGDLLGAWFNVHPPAQEATIRIENHDHPAMQPFEGMSSYTTFDEWYSFRTNPRERVHVLATLDESTIKNQKNDDWRMGDHPIIWWQEKQGMRSFYSGFGHTHEAFQNPLIVEHITRAINWAGKRIP
jgi:uncharacterized protein